MNSDLIDKALEKLHSQQFTFCETLRNPHLSSDQTFKPSRLEVYRGLVKGNISSFIDSAFPLTKSLLSPKDWSNLIDDYIQLCHATSPYFYDISLSFKEFLETSPNKSLVETYPWLIELLHFEWLELFIDRQDVLRQTPHPMNTGEFYIKTTIWVLAYQYPVYNWMLGDANIDFKIRPSCIMVWKDSDDHLRWLEVSPLVAFMLEQLIKLNLPFNQNNFLEQHPQNALQGIEAKTIDLAWQHTLYLLHHHQLINEEPSMSK